MTAWRSASMIYWRHVSNDFRGDSLRYTNSIIIIIIIIIIIKTLSLPASTSVFLVSQSRRI